MRYFLKESEREREREREREIWDVICMWYETYTSCPQVFSLSGQFVVNKDGISFSEAQETAVFTLVVPDGLHSAH